MSSDRNPNFSTTQWSVVLQAIQADPEKATVALERLCSRYWYPVYSFVRQTGQGAHEAEDLAQSFFHFLLSHQVFQRANPAKGRFRAFLLAALANFLHNERDKVQAQKRGGKNKIISLDEEFAEEVYTREIVDHQSPEKLFERRWAATLVRRVLDQLREEQEGRGRAGLFAGLQPFLTGEPVGADYDRIARQLGMQPGAVKVQLHRARRRFGELLRSEVAHTVSRPEDIEPEIRHLLAAIAE